MNAELFGLAIDAALSLPSAGIGTLSEKKVHAALKYYVQPDPDMHEIKTGNFICDAVSESTVFEIQTRCFSRLKPKLKALLPSHTVTVVYPVITEKTLIITDVDTGEVTIKKSPKKCTVYDAFYELCTIRDFLTDENLRLRLILMTAEEHRVCRIRKRKNGKTRSETLSSDRVPVTLLDDITVGSVNEYVKILPPGLGEGFTLKDFGKAASLCAPDASRAVFTLTCAGVCEKTGKRGNAYLYRMIIPGYYEK